MSNYIIFPGSIASSRCADHPQHIAVREAIRAAIAVVIVIAVHVVLSLGTRCELDDVLGPFLSREFRAWCPAGAWQVVGLAPDPARTFVALLGDRQLLQTAQSPCLHPFRILGAIVVVPIAQ